MKKNIAILSIMLAFMACNNEYLVLDTPSIENESKEISVSLIVTRSDEFGSTKATVKTAWANDDVIFVFFKGIAAPKYLEMKYVSSTDTWTSTAKNGLTSSDLSNAADKKMTAVYLPYGSTATVAASEGNFIFSDITYSGYFLKAELVTYNYDGDVLSGTLNMLAPELSNGSDKLIHFDISGFASGHDYKLYQDYVKPISFTSVSADGALTIDEGAMGDVITGYEDGSMMSFSGILDASAVGNAVDYQFTIDDLTSSTLYTRDAGTKTISTSKYIGIGAINNSATWNAVEYVDLGLSVRWAKCNLGAEIETDYGDYYAWGEIEPYYESGYAQENPQEHWKSGKTGGYIWTNYIWCNGSNTTMTKYCHNSENGNEGFTDDKAVLDLSDDAAHVHLKGKWRMPTKYEMQEIKTIYCTWTWTTQNGVYGCLISSNKAGYEGRSIFLPASGERTYEGLNHLDVYCSYWSNSNEGVSASSGAWYICYTSTTDGKALIGQNRIIGLPVRPVCPK